MSGSTTNLGLNYFVTTTDASSVLIYDYIDKVSGSLPNQNIGILDSFAGAISASIVSISGSVTNLMSKVYEPQPAVIQVVDKDTDVDTTSVFYFRAPTILDGMVLSRAQGFVNTAGTTGNTTIQIRNMTQYPSNDALSTPITISSGCVVGVPGVIDVDYDDVATDDQIRILVTSVSTTKPKGLQVNPEWIYSS